METAWVVGMTLLTLTVTAAIYWLTEDTETCIGAPSDAPRYRVTRNRYGASIERLGTPEPEDRYAPPRGPWDVEYVDE